MSPFAWLHLLSYGEEAKVRKCRHFYGGKKPERVDWVLEYDDLDAFVDTLDEDLRRSHRGIP